MAAAAAIPTAGPAGTGAGAAAAAAATPRAAVVPSVLTRRHLLL